MRVAWLACVVPLGALACTTSDADGGSTDGSGGGGVGGAGACLDECIQDNPTGAVLFENLADCLICVECFNDCGALEECQVPDAGEVGACDDKGVCSDDDPESDDCTSCALAGACKSVFESCKESGDCQTFGQCIQHCS